jgi:hypothetical protein
MILRPQLEPTDHQAVLDYYTAHYQEVHILSCNKCKEDLGIEIRGEISGYKMNDNGFTILPFGANLLASRVRSDSSMGYQCMCGNDTRGTALEEEMSPQGTFLPHEVFAIHQKQAEIGWKPKVKIKGNKEVHETFTRERVK